MSTPNHVPPVQTIQVETPVVAVAAPKFVRTKQFAKTIASRVGVPVLIGSAAAYVATRRVDKQDSEEEPSSTETE